MYYHEGQVYYSYPHPDKRRGPFGEWRPPMPPAPRIHINPAAINAELKAAALCRGATRKGKAV